MYAAKKPPPKKAKPKLTVVESESVAAENAAGGSGMQMGPMAGEGDGGGEDEFSPAQLAAQEMKLACLDYASKAFEAAPERLADPLTLAKEFFEWCVATE